MVEAASNCTNVTGRKAAIQIASLAFNKIMDWIPYKKRISQGERDRESKKR